MLYVVEKPLFYEGNGEIGIVTFETENPVTPGDTVRLNLPDENTAVEGVVSVKWIYPPYRSKDSKELLQFIEIEVR